MLQWVPWRARGAFQPPTAAPKTSASGSEMAHWRQLQPTAPTRNDQLARPPGHRNYLHRNPAHFFSQSCEFTSHSGESIQHMIFEECWHRFFEESLCCCIWRWCCRPSRDRLLFYVVLGTVWRLRKCLMYLNVACALHVWSV